ncbi:MAG: MgtC/SapB family protein [Ruminococcaceae bacterium]|nr:MgtC/SapB family protein [Oscillospiraceae bacterium]
MFDLQQAEYIFRVLLAGVCGIVVGLERKNRSKEAGIRTHFVVACGAALIMIISKYAFFDVIQSGAYGSADVRLDPSRVASTIASGIGFLGAGMIFVHKNTITGLTTAAGIWATSGLGMAIGSGMYVLGIAATLLILIAQLILHLRIFRTKNVRLKSLSIKEVSEEGYQRSLTEALEKLHIVVQEVSVERLDDAGMRNYIFLIELPDSVDEEDIITRIPYRSSIKSSM